KGRAERRVAALMLLVRSEHLADAGRFARLVSQRSSGGVAAGHWSELLCLVRRSSAPEGPRHRRRQRGCPAQRADPRRAPAAPTRIVRDYFRALFGGVSARPAP